MKEHEKLKKICDEIGYKYTQHGISYSKIRGEYCLVYTGRISIINVREIIFTKDFMDKYSEYIFKLGLDSYDLCQVLKHLDNPVDYLYDLIFKD